MNVNFKYSEQVNDLEKRIQAHQSFAERNIEDWIRELAAVTAGETILDVGCGTGNQVLSYAEDLQGLGFIHACDKSSDLIGAVQKRIDEAGLKNVSLHVHDMDQAFPFSDDFFDLISSCFAIYYTNDPAKLVSEIKQKLKKNGRFLIVGPTPQNTEDFWKMHEQVSGQSIPEKAIFRRDRIDKIFIPLLRQNFSNVQIKIFNNNIYFPDVQSVMDYYLSSPLFIEGVADGEKAVVAEKMRSAVTAQVAAEGKYCIKKEVYGIVSSN